MTLSVLSWACWPFLLGEVYVQSFVHLTKLDHLSFWELVRVLCIFWIFVRYRFREHFLPACSLPFHFLNSIFWKEKVLILKKSSSSMFPFMTDAFCVLRPSPASKSPRFSPVFSSRSFRVLICLFKVCDPETWRAAPCPGWSWRGCWSTGGSGWGPGLRWRGGQPQHRGGSADGPWGLRGVCRSPTSSVQQSVKRAVEFTLRVLY